MTISSPGIGSGLDVNSIVSQLVALERQPVQLMQAKGSDLQAKVSAYGQVKSSLAALQDAATAMVDTSTWKSRTFASNNTSAVTGSATSTALAGSFSVQVTQLAQAQSTRSSAFATGATVGSAGSLEIQTGQWTGTSFNGGANAKLTVSIAATDTLTDVATKINSSGAGVSAVVVSSGGQDRLLVQGGNTGDASGFQIRAFDATSTEITDGTTGAGAFAYASPAGGGAIYGQTQTQAAQNSSISINGIAVSSATNTVADAVPGVTLNLLATTTTATQITVGVDKDAIKTKIQAFQDAYNKINASLADMTRYDAATKTSGPLQGDSTAVGLQNMLKNLLGATGPSGTGFSRLSDVGLQLQRDGSLTTNSTKLDAALGNLNGLQTFLGAATGTASGDGIVRRIRDFAMGANGIGGSISGRSTALQSAITRNNNDIDALNTRVANVQKQLQAQYSRLDSTLGSINSMGSFVTSQLAQWNKSG